MSIRFCCPACRTAYTVNDRDAGQKSECKVCGQRIAVPVPHQKKTVLGEYIPDASPEAPAGPRSTAQVANSPPTRASSAEVVEQSPIPVAPPEWAGERRSGPRTGLIAVGIVGSLFLSAGCLIGLLAWVTSAKETGQSGQGSGSDSPTSKSLAYRPLSEGNQRDDEAYIMGHRWWKKPPTRAKLDELVRFVIETNADHAIWVDDQGQYTRSNQYFGEGFGRTWITPGELRGKRYFWFVTLGSKRPERRDVLHRIRSEIDSAEYKEGPGR